MHIHSRYTGSNKPECRPVKAKIIIQVWPHTKDEVDIEYRSIGQSGMS